MTSYTSISVRAALAAGLVLLSLAPAAAGPTDSTVKRKSRVRQPEIPLPVQDDRLSYKSRLDVSAEVVAGAVRISISSPRAHGREQVTLFRRNVSEVNLGGSSDRQYLSSLDTTGSVAIGNLIVRGRERYYSDEDVQPATTYAYWIRSHDGITRPVAVRVRDKRVWWGKSEVSHTIDAIARAHPHEVDVERYGRTTRGWNIRGLRAGNREITLALVGSVHAGESGPEIILPLFERLLAEDHDLLDDVGVAVLPLVNADERQKMIDGTPWYLRKNSDGVDINRNFDADWEVVDNSYGISTADPSTGTYRGPEPASENETRAVVSFVERTHPAVLLSFHGLTSATGPMFVTAVRGSQDYFQRTVDVARAYQSGYSGQPSIVPGSPVQMMQRSVSGSLALWMSLRFDVPAADLELEASPALDTSKLDLLEPQQLEDLRERHYQAVKRLLEFLREQQWGTPGQ